MGSTQSTWGIRLREPSLVSKRPVTTRRERCMMTPYVTWVTSTSKKSTLQPTLVPPLWITLSPAPILDTPAQQLLLQEALTRTRTDSVSKPRNQSRFQRRRPQPSQPNRPPKPRYRNPRPNHGSRNTGWYLDARLLSYFWLSPRFFFCCKKNT